MSGWAVWFVGLPGSGKSSISKRAYEYLRDKGMNVVYLQMDERRKKYFPDPKYTPEERRKAYELFALEGADLAAKGHGVILDGTAAKVEMRHLSRKKIDKALAETQQFLRCNPKINWVAGLYQFANRIAHLYFFREKCGLDLWLVHIYFCNDQTHNIKTSKEEFEGAMLLAKKLLGLGEHRLNKYILNLFVYTDRTFPTFG